MLERQDHRIALEQRLATTPVVALIGARQVGNTTIAQRIATDRTEAHYFGLERPADLARLTEPELSLGPLSGLVILDEIQRRPDLFPVPRQVPASACSMVLRGLTRESTHPRKPEVAAPRVRRGRRGPKS